MSGSNRDHAKNKHRPMVEDEAIASLARSFIETSYHLPRKLLPPVGTNRQNPQLSVNGSSGANLTVARRGGSDGTDKNVSSRRFALGVAPKLLVNKQ